MTSEGDRLAPETAETMRRAARREVAVADQQRRLRTYMLMLTLGALGAGAGLVADRSSATPSDALAMIWGATAVLLVGLAVATQTGRLSIGRLEQVLLLSTTALALGSLAYWRHVTLDPNAAQTGVMVTLHWTPILFIFCFIAYRGRQALLYALAILGLVVLITATGPLRPEWDSPYFGGVANMVHVYLAYVVLLGCLTFFSDLRQRASAMEETAQSMQLLANTDPLTGLANRRQMETLLHRELQRAARYGRSFSLIMMDIDAFKSINDSQGHQVGDQVLVDLAVQVRGKVRSTDTVARWGGEEFLVLVPETGLEEGLRMAEALRVEIETQLLAGQRLTVSLGVAGSRPGDDARTLLARADAALYQAKEEGRNAVRQEYGYGGEADPARMA